MQNIEERLTICDKEPIHIIGGIQPHGCFLAFHGVTGKVMHASRNVAEYLKLTTHKIVGRRLSDLFAEEQANKVLTVASGPLPHYLHIESQGENYNFEVFLYEIEGLIAAEFELSRDSASQAAESKSNLQMRTKNYIGDLSSQSDLSEAARLTCRAVRDITGFERVMCYRFLPTWEGVVIAEDKIAEAQSFLRHLFPATDIPAQARQLYFINRTRLIADARTSAVPIEPPMHAIHGHPLDLSHSKLRAVSLMHLEYLKNMGVVSSASFAIINNGQLWGLIACHGSQPNYLSHEARLTCEAVTSAFALAATLLETNQKQRERLEFETKLRNLFSEVRLKADPLDSLFKNAEKLLQIFRSSGMAYVSKSRIDITGLTPTVEQIRTIATTARVNMQTKRQHFLAVRSLAQVDEKLEGISQIASGMLVVSVPELDDSLFMFFRPELLAKTVWGGDPSSVDKSRNYQGTINPRKSFESWTETVQKNSEPWESYEVAGITFLRDFIFDALVKKEVLIQELGKQLTAARQNNSD